CVGAAYDLFGTGKTSIKGSLGRFVNGIGMGAVDRQHPASSLVATANRTWNDQFFGAGDPRSRNYAPDCDLRNTAASGESRPLDNSRFGQVVRATTYASDVRTGFGNRISDWQASAGVQQELWSGTGVELSFFRTSYAAREVTANLALNGVADFNTYCITAPTDP